MARVVDSLDGDVSKQRISRKLHAEAVWGAATGMAATAILVVLVMRLPEALSPPAGLGWFSLAGEIVFLLYLVVVPTFYVWLITLAPSCLVALVLYFIGRLMSWQLVPRWYPALTGGFVVACLVVFAPRAVSEFQLTLHMASALAWTAAAAFACQCGASFWVERAIRNEPTIAAAYATLEPLRFTVRNLLALTTVAALLAAVLGAVAIPWQVGWAGMLALAVQAVAIAGFAVWRRSRSRLEPAAGGLAGECDER